MKIEPRAVSRTISGRHSPRKTKIICTLGPATSSLETIERLVGSGMNCARLNFSHGTLEEHSDLIRKVRKASETHVKSVAIMQDLPGAKIRVGELKDGAITLKRGSTVSIIDSDKSQEENVIPIRQSNFIQFVPAGATIFLSDGLIRLKVISKNTSSLVCRCLNGGRLLSGKGVNIPELAHGFVGFTRQDEEYLKFGLVHGVDLIAVSFVQNASDIHRVRRVTERSRSNSPWIVAKIERREAVRNMHEIIGASDVVMVARGDLGVENAVEDVPIIQKTIISECNRRAVPVITATQMLESMVSNPRPTRAEASDASNAVLDGTDALMLSEETAIGSYPVECVKTLDKVAKSSENWIFDSRKDGLDAAIPSFHLWNDALPGAAVSLSKEVKANLLVCPTTTGALPKRISREKSPIPLVGLTKSSELCRKLSIVWGVTSLHFEENSDIIWGTGRSSSIELLRRVIAEKLISSGFGKRGERVVLARDTSEENKQKGDLLLTFEIS